MYCVVYRIGGTESFSWRRTLPTDSLEQADTQQAEIERMGYRCYLEDYDRSMAVGLPETAEPSDEGLSEFEISPTQGHVQINAAVVLVNPCSVDEADWDSNLRVIRWDGKPPVPFERYVLVTLSGYVLATASTMTRLRVLGTEEISRVS